VKLTRSYSYCGSGKQRQTAPSALPMPHVAEYRFSQVFPPGDPDHRPDHPEIEQTIFILKLTGPSRDMNHQAQDHLSVAVNMFVFSVYATYPSHSVHVLCLVSSDASVVDYIGSVVDR